MDGLAIVEMRGCQTLFLKGDEPDFASHTLGSYFVDALEFYVNALTQLKRVGGIQEFLQLLNLPLVSLFAL